VNGTKVHSKNIYSILPREKRDMVVCSIFTSKEEVFRLLQSFLREREYRRIIINEQDHMITAQRRDSFLSKKYSVKFVVHAKSLGVSDIEITVNPQHTVPSVADTKQEDKIRSRIYFYF